MTVIEIKQLKEKIKTEKEVYIMNILNLQKLYSKIGHTTFYKKDELEKLSCEELSIIYHSI